MRGLVLGWSEVSNSSVINYIAIAKKNGLNTFSIYNAPRGTLAWTTFERDCANAGIDIEFEEHMMSFLLPRDKFSVYPDWFRMDKKVSAPMTQTAVLHQKVLWKKFIEMRLT